MFLANFRGGVPRVQMDFFEFFLHKSSSTHRYFKGEYSGAPGAPVFTLFEKVVLSKFEFNLPTHYYTNTCVTLTTFLERPDVLGYPGTLVENTYV